MSKKENINETVSNEASDASIENTPKKNMKKLKYGSMSIVVICLVVAIVVVANIMVGMLAKRSPLKIDLTPDKRYDLSDESIDALRKLDNEVEIVVTMKKDLFTSMANYYTQMYRSYGYNTNVPFDMIPVILEKYEMYANQGKGSINVKYVDMDKDPDVITKYSKNYNGEIEEGSIIVASGERVKVLNPGEVMGMIAPAQQGSSQSTTTNLQFVFAGESVLTSAVTSVTDAHPISVAFVRTSNGIKIYNEAEYEAAVNAIESSLLEKNGYDCTDIDIAADELDIEKYDMVVVPAPSTDFTENIIEKFSKFLYNDGNYGKSMLYIPSLMQTNLPNIADFLADWSIQVDNNLIADDTNAMMQNTNIFLNITDSEKVGELPSDKLPIVAPYSKEISVITKHNEDVVSTILQSYNTAYTFDLLTQQPSEEEAAHGVAVMSQKQHAEQFDVYTSSVLVLGSIYMADEELLTQTSTYNNANVLLGILNNMTGKEAAAVIPEKSLQSAYIAVTQSQAKIIKAIVIWAIPIIVAAIGCLVLVRRRNK